MSDSDSFLSEVSEEVRRERFYGTLRRFRWLLIGAVVALIGGVAYNEWRVLRLEANAQAAGDALSAALAVADPVERAAALEALASGADGAVARIAEAGAKRAAGDAAGAAEVLAQVAEDGAVPEPYRALAALQRVMILGPDLAPSERMATLDALAGENAPFRLLALEQRALAKIEAGDRAGAVADLRLIVEAPTAPDALRGRARQLLLAAGGAESVPTPAPASGG